MDDSLQEFLETETAALAEAVKRRRKIDKEDDDTRHAIGFAVGKLFGTLAGNAIAVRKLK